MMAYKERTWVRSYDRSEPSPQENPWKDHQGPKDDHRGSYDSYRPMDNKPPKFSASRRPTAGDWFDPPPPLDRENNHIPPRRHNQWKSEDFKLREQYAGNTSRTSTTRSDGLDARSPRPGGAQRSQDAETRGGPKNKRSSEPEDFRRSTSYHERQTTSAQDHGANFVGNEPAVPMDLDPEPLDTAQSKANLGKLRVETTLKEHLSELAGGPATDGQAISASIAILEGTKPSDKTQTTQPLAYSGNLTPQSTVMDTGVASPGLNSAGEQTPIPRTPLTGHFTVPPPPGAHDQNKESSTEKSLMQSLFQFSQTVNRLASVTVSRDTVKAIHDEKEKDYHRWAVHHQSFTSLAQQQDKEMKRMKNDVERQNERVKKHEDARDQALQHMAKTIARICGGLPIQKADEDSNRIKTLEMDVKDLRRGVNNVKDSLNTFPKHDHMRLESLEQGQSHLSQNLAEIQTTMGSFNDNIVSLKKDAGQSRAHQSSIARLDSRVSTIERYGSRSSVEKETTSTSGAQLEDLKKDVSILQEQIVSVTTGQADLYDRVTPVSTLQGDVEKLQEASKKTNDSLHSLKVEVVGSGADNPGLFDLLESQEQRIDGIKKSLLGLDDALSNQTTGLNTRIKSLEFSQRAGSSRVATDEWRAKFDKRFIIVEGGIEELRKDQDIKDEIVGKDVEALQEACSKLETNFDISSNKFEVSMELIRSDLRNLQDEIARLSSSTNLRTSNSDQAEFSHSLQQDNGVQRVDVMTGAAIQDLQQRFTALETLTISLEQRYNNIYTETLAQNMIHQMKKMYPYPADALRDLSLLKENYAASLQAYSTLSSRLASLENRTRTIQQDALMTSEQSKSAEAENAKQIDLLEKRVNLLFLELSNKLRLAKGVTEELKEELGDYGKQIGDLTQNLSELREVIEEGKTEFSKQKSEIASLRKWMFDNQDTNTRELADLHGKVARVDNDLAFLVEPNRTTEEGNDITNSTSVADSVSSVLGIDPAEERHSQEPVPKKSILTKKKDALKRTRRHSDDSGNEKRHKRKARTEQWD